MDCEHKSMLVPRLKSVHLFFQLVAAEELMIIADVFKLCSCLFYASDRQTDTWSSVN